MAQSGDPELERRAERTLRADARLRAERLGGEQALRAGMPATTVTHLTAGGKAKPAAPHTESEFALSRAIHDAGHRQSLPGVLVRAEGADPTGDDAVNQAYDGLGATFTLFAQVYERNSIDDKGMTLVATVHYGKDYDNAFWNGEQMVFGDGDGVIFNGFTEQLDVIGHELTHGVTQYTAGLNYQGQSGALNESVSDVFGSLVKQYALGQSAADADWLIGAGLLAPGVQGIALRSMKAPGTAYDDPRLGKDPQPAHMADYVQTREDNGGVHINSGIPNHAFYLAATALGGSAWETAGRVWLDVLMGDIKADCDFETFAQLTVAAAARRLGQDSADTSTIRDAWISVGVLSADAATGQSEARPKVSSGTGLQSGSASTTDSAAAPTVTVRRSGGFAGLVAERTVGLDELPSADRQHWERLLEGDRLERMAATASMHPDAFCYGVACPASDVDVSIPEPGLSESIRGLLDRTLAL